MKTGRKGLTQAEVERLLGRSHTTISREIARSGGRQRYRAHFADEEAWERTRRPKPLKLERCGVLRELVVSLLECDHSPEQIAGHLARTYPDNEQMRVSHETIYRALFVQSRGT